MGFRPGRQQKTVTSEEESPWRPFLAAIAGLMAIALLLLALPRTIASLLTLPSTAVLQRLQSQRPVSFEDLERVVSAQRRAIRLSSDGRLGTDLGLAELLIAERLPGDDPNVRGRLQNAVDALRQGLAAAPGNPYAWARLAYAEARQQGWTPLALSGLRMALLTAPYDPRLIWSRLRLSLLAWPYMPIEDREIVLQQVRWAWIENAAELARLAVEVDQVNVVRAALLRMPEAAGEFEKLLPPRRS
jgi:hypothetical protein